MGSSDSTSNTSQSSTTAPGSMTSGTVQGIIGQLNPLISSSGLTSDEQSAINTLKTNAAAGNPYATQEGTNATNLLAGGGATDQNGALSSNLATLKGTLGTYTDPNYSTVNSPEVQRALQAANAGITNQVNSQFAAAGRSGSTANTGNLAYNEEQADAPILLNQANTDTTNRMAAANTLYGAGNTTSGAITANNQTALGNEQAGTTAATSALSAANQPAQATITADELGQSIPAQNLGMLSQIGIPLAGLNTTTSGTGTTNSSTSPSLLQDITGIGTVIGMLSDRRAKEDITRIGALFDGTPVYRYRYIGQPAYQIGLMAQDVEKHSPEAVIELPNGFKAVEYKAATEKAAHCLDWGC